MKRLKKNNNDDFQKDGSEGDLEANKKSDKGSKDDEFLKADGEEKVKIIWFPREKKQIWRP
jgi:hypothetical protein